MTTLKTPEEVTLDVIKEHSDVLDIGDIFVEGKEGGVDVYDGTEYLGLVLTSTITEDRQHIAEVLCELLEGEIEALEHNEYCSLKEVPKEVASCGCWHQKEETLHKAQALIRQTLDPISNQE